MRAFFQVSKIEQTSRAKPLSKTVHTSKENVKGKKKEISNPQDSHYFPQMLCLINNTNMQLGINE